MKVPKKLFILIVILALILSAFSVPATASTFVPIITMQPIITAIIPLPSATPTSFTPIITSLIPIPTLTFEIAPIPIPLDVLTSWKVVNDSEPLYYPIDVVADRSRVKILDWQNGGRLNILDIESDTWYYLEPPSSIGAMLFPSGMCEGENGSVYIADTYNDRVLKCSANGSWTVVADTGFDTPTGVAYYNGTLYVADSGHDRIRYFKNGVWDEIVKVGTSTTFNSLSDVKVKNGGGLLIADGGNDYIINRSAVSKAYEIISDATYTDYYLKVFPDKDNNLYITSLSSDTLSKFNGITFTQLMSKGSNVGQVENPAGVFDDGLGTVYVADMGNNRVQRNKSAENTLADLALDSSTVTGFSPNTKNYSVSVPQSKANINVSAISTSPYADVTGDLGSQSLSYGENVFTINCDPETGSDGIYTITITRQEPPTPTPSAAPDTPTATPASSVSGSSAPSGEPSPGSSESLLPPVSPNGDNMTSPDASDIQAQSEDAKDSEGVPTWAVILITVLACAILAVVGILIYMGIKGKKGGGQDFE